MITDSVLFNFVDGYVARNKNISKSDALLHSCKKLHIIIIGTNCQFHTPLQFLYINENAMYRYRIHNLITILLILQTLNAE